ncbi:MAG: hypothetical protein ABI689_17870 [Thermoanaerobaculia bacterium]
MLFFAGILALGEVAAAQNALVFNPEFDVNLDDWGYGVGQTQFWEADDADGCPLSGSVSMTSIPGDNSLVAAFAADCLPVNEGDYVWLQATYKSPNPVTLYLFQYTTANCSGAYTDSSSSTTPASAVWRTADLFVGIFPPPDTQSVRFVTVSSDPDPNNSFTLSLDRAYLGSRSRIFADDFDGASTCRWTSAVL